MSNKINHLSLVNDMAEKKLKNPLPTSKYANAKAELEEFLSDKRDLRLDKIAKDALQPKKLVEDLKHLKHEDDESES